MKTTVEIPSEELSQLIAYTGAQTKKEAINLAIKSYNKRQRLTALAERLGTFENFMEAGELNSMRKE